MKMKIGCRRAHCAPQAGIVLCRSSLLHGAVSRLRARQGWAGDGDFVLQRNYERIAWLDTKSGRLLSVLVNVAVAHMPVRIERVAHFQGDF